MPLAIAAILLASEFNWLSTRTLGEATLTAIAATVVGFVVLKVWPKALNPQLFAVLAAFSLLGGLAYAGFAGAGLALALFLVAGLLLAFAGVMM